MEITPPPFPFRSTELLPFLHHPRQVCSYPYINIVLMVPFKSSVRSGSDTPFVSIHKKLNNVTAVIPLDDYRSYTDWQSV